MSAGAAGVGGAMGARPLGSGSPSNSNATKLIQRLDTEPRARSGKGQMYEKFSILITLSQTEKDILKDSPQFQRWLSGQPGGRSKIAMNKIVSGNEANYRAYLSQTYPDYRVPLQKDRAEYPLRVSYVMLPGERESTHDITSAMESINTHVVRTLESNIARNITSLETTFAPASASRTPSSDVDFSWLRSLVRLGLEIRTGAKTLSKADLESTFERLDGEKVKAGRLSGKLFYELKQLLLSSVDYVAKKAVKEQDFARVNDLRSKGLHTLDTSVAITTYQDSPIRLFAEITTGINKTLDYTLPNTPEFTRTTAMRQFA